MFELELRQNCQDYNSDSVNERKTLEILEVTGFMINDTERIGCYDLNTIQYKRPELQLITGIPLGLNFRVRKLHMRLFSH